MEGSLCRRLGLTVYVLPSSGWKPYINTNKANFLLRQIDPLRFLTKGESRSQAYAKLVSLNPTDCKEWQGLAAVWKPFILQTRKWSQMEIEGESHTQL